jgi:hypothetical protein
MDKDKRSRLVLEITMDSVKSDHPDEDERVQLVIANDRVLISGRKSSALEINKDAAIQLILNTIRGEADKANFSNRDKMLIYGGYDGEVYVDQGLAGLIFSALKEKGIV